MKIYIETGKKRTVISAVEWPGWFAFGRDEAQALEKFAAVGGRYAVVLQGTGLDFSPPKDTAALQIVERLTGDATTDFGAPAIIPTADRAPVSTADLARWQTLLQACWWHFDQAVTLAEGVELRKGPRGGGRDLEKIQRHVLEADHAYLQRIAYKHKIGDGDLISESEKIRVAILTALAGAVKAGLPEKGPRGGVIWPARYFVRRVTYHVLDHTWEIENRTD